MANVVVTVKIMPEDPETDLDVLQKEAEKVINKYAGQGDIREAREPVAFGLVALKLTFVMDEKKGDLDPLEDILRQIEDVESVETIEVRRALI